MVKSSGPDPRSFRRWRPVIQPLCVPPAVLSCGGWVVHQWCSRLRAFSTQRMVHFWMVGVWTLHVCSLLWRGCFFLYNFQMAKDFLTLDVHAWCLPIDSMENHCLLLSSSIVFTHGCKYSQVPVHRFCPASTMTGTVSWHYQRCGVSEKAWIWNDMDGYVIHM